MDEDGVGRPAASAIELGDEVEVADGHELHTGPCGGEPGRHVPGRDAQRGRVRSRERKVSQMKTPHEGEAREPLGVPADLADEGDGFAAPRRRPGG